MANLSPETIERLNRFKQSQKFAQLNPQTQERLNKFVGASTPQPNIMGDAIKQGLKSATDPILSPFGMGSQQREMGEMYGKGREAILESNIPLVGKGARAAFSEEGPTLTIPDNPITGRQDLKFSPQNIVKQIQGLGVDMATGLPVDAALAKGPAMAGSISKMISEGLGEAAGGVINTLIKPGKKAFRFNRNPGRAVAQEVGPKLNMGQLEEGIGEAKKRIYGELVKKASAKRGQKIVDATPIFEQIRNTVEELGKFPETYGPQIEAHRGFARDLETIVRQKGTIGKDGRIYLDPVDAVDLKRAIGELPSWDMNDPKLGSLTATSRKAYGAFNESIGKAVPELKAPNKTYSELMEANKAASSRNAQGQTRDAVSYPEAAALAFGGPVGWTLVGGKRVLSGTPFKTTVAAGLSQGARAGKGAARMLEGVKMPSIIEELIGKIMPKKKWSTGRPMLEGSQTTIGQIGGPPSPVESVGPRRLKPTQFEGEGFQMGDSEFGGSPTPQIRPGEQLGLPAPENIYGEGFKTLTPEEQVQDRLRKIVMGLPEGPTPEFPEVYVPGPYSEVRPIQPEVPFRGRVELEPKSPREYAKKSSGQKGEKTKQVNKLLERFKIWGLKGMED